MPEGSLSSFYAVFYNFEGLWHFSAHVSFSIGFYNCSCEFCGAS